MPKNPLVPRPYVVVWAGLALLLLFNAPAASGKSIGVTNTNDSGPGSLRSAIASAASGDSIFLSPKAIRLPATITLSSTLFILQNLTIAGPGASLLAISGGNVVEVFNIGQSRVVSISGVTIENGNAYPEAGGGIFNDGALTLSNCVLSGNTAGIGGGIYSQENPLTLTNSTLSGNSAGDGGGIYNFAGTVTLINSTVAGNSGTAAGGGIVNQGALTLSSSTLSGNNAPFGGGIYNDFGMSVTLGNSTLSGNTAAQEGGAIYNQGTLTISDSTLSGNSAGLGGGVSNEIGTIALLPGDFAPSSGGNFEAIQVSTTLKNTILANSAPAENCTVVFGNLTSLGYNLSDDPSCATFFNQPGDMNSTGAGLDPGGLNNNGGPTQTIALLPSSPAVDAIPASQCTDTNSIAVTADQRGVARPQGRGCDIGALELVPAGSGLPVAQSK